MTMTRKLWLSMIGVGMLTLTIGCARQTPLAPEDVGSAVSDAQLELTASMPVVTLMSDLTAAPAMITVPALGAVQFVNNSARFVTIHSYNCTEFSLLRIPAGYSRRTTYFRPAGKTCDYFAWDDNWSRQIFVGQVVVQ
jgi:hypothetical protein